MRQCGSWRRPTDGRLSLQEGWLAGRLTADSPLSKFGLSAVTPQPTAHTRPKFLQVASRGAAILPPGGTHGPAPSPFRMAPAGARAG
jgi:hypothetical protein